MRFRFSLFSLAAVLFLLVLFPATDRGYALDIPLPPLILPAPPPVVVIPGTYVYVVPDIDDDLVFFHDFWYRPYKGKWYRATYYNGPWVIIHSVPPAILGLPPGFRHVSPGHERIPYGHMKKNWRKWEEEKHWGENGKGKGKGKHKGRKH